MARHSIERERERHRQRQERAAQREREQNAAARAARESVSCRAERERLAREQARLQQEDLERQNERQRQRQIAVQREYERGEAERAQRAAMEAHARAAQAEWIERHRQQNSFTGNMGVEGPTGEIQGVSESNPGSGCDCNFCRQRRGEMPHDQMQSPIHREMRPEAETRFPGDRMAPPPSWDYSREERLRERDMAGRNPNHFYQQYVNAPFPENRPDTRELAARLADCAARYSSYSFGPGIEHERNRDIQTRLFHEFQEILGRYGVTNFEREEFIQQIQQQRRLIDRLQQQLNAALSGTQPAMTVPHNSALPRWVVPEGYRWDLGEWPGQSGPIRQVGQTNAPAPTPPPSKYKGVERVVIEREPETKS